MEKGGGQENHHTAFSLVGSKEDLLKQYMFVDGVVLEFKPPP